MRKRLILPPLLALLFLSVPHAFAQQDAEKADAAAKQLANALAAADAANTAQPHVIKELELTDVPLAEVIEYLRKQDPAFQALVAYGPDADRNGPLIQELRLKNVTAETVLNALAATYEPIRIDPIEGSNGSVLYTIRVESAGKRGGGLYGGSGGGGGGGVSGGTGLVTTVHRLNEIIDGLSESNAGQEGRAKALASVLSLVQAAVETEADGAAVGRSGPARDVKLKLHETTETLLFKGSDEQADLVERALRSLRPSDVEQVETAQRQAAQMKEQLQRIEQRFAEADQERRNVEDKAGKLAVEVERLHAQVREYQKRVVETETRLGEPVPPVEPGDAQPNRKPKQP